MLAFTLHNPIVWDNHRSGWKYVMDLLEPYHCEHGVIVDGFIDATFGFRAQQCRDAEVVPYQQAWVGFWHHPPTMPPWYPFNEQDILPECIIQKEAFQASLPFCQGVYTFSEYLAKYLRGKIEVPIEVLYHPTEFPATTFDFDAFTAKKQMVQVGNWIRRLATFYRFEAPGYDKIHLLGDAGATRLKLELEHCPDDEFIDDEVNLLSFVEDEMYDTFLSESIVFVDLFDSSVNNVLLECMARNTPLLINRIEPVVEYLGEEYPFYYTCPDDIIRKIADQGLVYATSQYLQSCDTKERLTADFFISSLKHSTILSDV